MIWATPAADTYFAPMLMKDPRGFQIDHLERAMSYCKQFRKAVDGGAHIGTWSRAMAQRFEVVMAFEPARDTFDCLCENTVGVGSIVKFQSALGDKGQGGFISVVDDPTRKGNTGSRYLDPLKPGDVQVLSIDPFEMKDLDFLKLDLEGYELFALRGAEQTIRLCRPVVLIEAKKFNPQRFGVDEEAASHFIMGLGYRMAEQIGRDRIFVYD